MILRSMFATLIVLSACTPSINQAAKSDIDRRVSGLSASDQIAPALIFPEKGRTLETGNKKRWENAWFFRHTTILTEIFLIYPSAVRREKEKIK